MKTFEEFRSKSTEFRSKSTAYTKSEIQEFLRDFDVPSSMIDDYDVDSILDYVKRHGLFYGNIKDSDGNYKKQTWEFHFHPQKNLYKIFYKQPRIRNNRAWIRDDKGDIVELKSLLDAKKYALLYIMNTIKFENDCSIEHAKELVKKCRMRKTAKKFGI